MRSFINFMLPDDEYQRLKVLYFLAESAVLVVFVAGVISILDLFFFDWNLWLLWILPWIMLSYVFYRYVFSGLEYSEVSTPNQYKKRKRKSLTVSLATAVLFYVVSVLTSGGFADKYVALDKLGLATTFFIIYYAIDRISLARSYRKNKEIDDD